LEQYLLFEWLTCAVLSTVLVLQLHLAADGDINEAEEELLREWLGVVHKKNRIMRRESELIYL